MKSKYSQNAFALVLVLWILTLLALMAGSFAKTMRRDSSISLALKNNAQASALTESVFGWAVSKLQSANAEQPWLLDGTIYQILRQDGSQIRIKIVSESGKIDINAANNKLLASVIKSITGDLWAEQKLLNSILDWRDADEDPRPHGAEKKQYLEAGLNYIPSNAPFQSVDELRLVLGMEPELFMQIQAFLTVYSGQGEVNTALATPEVLQLLGNIDGMTAQENIGSQAIDANQGLSQGVAGSYTITVEVKMDNETSQSLEAVVQLPDQNAEQQSLQIFEWRPNQLMQSLFAYGMDFRLITLQDEFTNFN